MSYRQYQQMNQNVSIFVIISNGSTKIEFWRLVLLFDCIFAGDVGKIGNVTISGFGIACGIFIFGGIAFLFFSECEALSLLATNSFFSSRYLQIFNLLF